VNAIAKAFPQRPRPGASPASRSLQPPSPATGVDVAPEVARVGQETLYGSLQKHGVVVSCHHLRSSAPTALPSFLRPGALAVCLNLEGPGSPTGTIPMTWSGPMTESFLAVGEARPACSSDAGQPHRTVTIEFSPDFLRKRLSASDGALHPVVESFLQQPVASCRIGLVRPLSPDHQRLAHELCSPVVPQAARSLWYESKLLQVIVDFFFERVGDDELFCDRQKRLARERSARVVAILMGRLAEPPSLEDIGREVGCSPFHLSRTFSREMGMTIPQYLRKARMERAAELLRSGRYNVTEAAMEVGYSSLSHFSQAFCQTMGCCPGLFPLQAREPRAQGTTPPRGGNKQPAVKL